MSEIKTETFGLHLMVDVYHCPEQVLDNFSSSYTFLSELPSLLGMKVLIPPYVIHADANDVKDPGGWTGFVVIQESHISVHTFPKRGFVTIDVYSCKTFDTDAALSFIKKNFQSDDIEYYIQERGKRYPKENIYE